ncbi:MAG: hypothetical protein FIA92_08835 [Chloroflexi bacterium]|nr:hypothetical protein [Chloroflexota bacterium]
MSHPSLGLPPRDLSAGRPDAGAILTASRSRIAARALEIALELDSTMGERHDELALRGLLADLSAFIDRLAIAVAAEDPGVMANFAEMVAVRYRKRAIPMDDVVTLCEGLRRSAQAVLPSAVAPVVDPAIDEGIRVFRWHRRIAGDARKRNPLLAFIYRGA